MVNKKGFVDAPVFFMLFVLITILAIILVDPLLDVSAESQSNMDCTNSSISDYDKSNCMAVDATPFIFVGALLAIAGGIIGIKWLS